MHLDGRNERSPIIRRQRPHLRRSSRRSSRPSVAALAAALLLVLAAGCSPGGPESAGEDVHASNPEEDAYAEPLTTEPLTTEPLTTDPADDGPTAGAAGRAPGDE